MTNIRSPKRNPYTFSSECDSCGDKPVLRDLGMCSVCTFGEAGTLWDWLYYRWEGRELQQAQSYLKNMQRDLMKHNMDFAPDINRRVRHLLSFRNYA